MISFLKVLANIAGVVAALMSILLFLRLHWPAALQWVLKLFVSALSYVFVSVGLLCTFLGTITNSLFLILVGLYDTVIFFIHILRVTRPPLFFGGLENQLGVQLEQKITNNQRTYFLPTRTVLTLPPVPNALLQRDVPFSIIPGTSRQLLCDIWQPHENIKRSGVVFIYLHGSAWYLLDKDLGTRPFFNHLAAQGHVVMDVAYRMAPETDMMGMIHDAKRAIAWMKESGSRYGIHPDKIIIGGGSAGGHLALMAAYTAHEYVFTPIDLEGKDITVDSVISLYGPSDLTSMYYHLNQHLTTRSIGGKSKKAPPTQMPGWLMRKMGKEYYRLHMEKGFANAGAFVSLFGCHPDECPQPYSLFSPLTHVNSECPPTLLIQGEHDVMAPVESTRTLYARLMEQKVPVIMHILPQTDHAFDLILPKISASAHNAIYDIERFLASRSKSFANNHVMSEENEDHQLHYA